MPQSQTQPHGVSEIHDIFDVESIEPIEVELSADVEQKWESEAGMLVAPPVSSPWSVGEPSKPLFGRLPLARVIPQDVHSIMDYADGSGVMAGAFFTDCAKAKAASLVLGSSAILASAVTDYKLSLAKIVPIEAHEAVDYAFGLSAIAAPFVLGYRKTAPVVAALHVAIGVGVILSSLFTDYRAYRGVGRQAAT